MECAMSAPGGHASPPRPLPGPPPGPMPGPPLLEVRELRVTFTRRGRRVHAVNGLSYELSAGEILAIIGESGSGKTVGARTLMGLLPPSAQVSGSARFDGTELVGMPEPQIRHW